MAQDQAVHDHLDGMLDLFVQNDFLIQCPNGPIDPDPDIATVFGILENFLMLALSAQHHRSHQYETGALGIAVE
ncbi:hypothetical protein SDC9_187836 [bioreactor metagenome]|uniref:Uncharacterized protein n=1 Tax=bioreactor metagenome TaxID=1076179 RepID=A0A645HN93_9ZZZZ